MREDKEGDGGGGSSPWLEKLTFCERWGLFRTDGVAVGIVKATLKRK